MGSYEDRLQREHELAMAKAQNPGHEWIATAVGYASIAAVVIAAFVTGFAQWLLSQ
jgi:hypothetical protein